MKKVVCIGDDLKFNQLVTNYFSENQIRVITQNGNVKAEQVHSLESDVLLIDLSSPNEKIKYLLAKQIREMSDIPVLFTSSKRNDDITLKSINFCLVDFIRKPVDMVEMVARMNKLITSTSKFNNMNKLKFGEAILLLCEQTIEYEEKRIHLSRMETKILYKLYQHRNEYIERNTLVCKIWEITDYKLRKGTFGNILCKIRKKIKCIEGICIDTQISSKIKLIIPE